MSDEEEQMFKAAWSVIFVEENMVMEKWEYETTVISLVNIEDLLIQTVIWSFALVLRILRGCPRKNR